ncbi:MAG: hypothetical protein FWD77_05425 [Betaproteobacteria bacterium]|nr:hypothetical protein [Betaproteobacteria bacterium]
MPDAKIPSIRFRRAEERDYVEILALLELFYVENLTREEARRSGFIGARFDRKMLERMNAAPGIIVAEEENAKERILGALALERSDTKTPVNPLAPTMREAMRHYTFARQPLPTRQTFFFGPVCVTPGARGRGVLRGLYAAMWAHLDPARYHFGVTSIAKQNQRAFTAHCQGLGLSILGDFFSEGEAYWLIGYPRPA